MTLRPSTQEAADEILERFLVPALSTASPAKRAAVQTQLELPKRLPAYGLTNPAGLNRFQKALAAAERTPARIIATGNSVFDGVSTDTTTTPPDADMDLYGSWGVVRSLFAREFGAVKAGAIPAADTRWTLSVAAGPTTIGNTCTGPGGGKFRILAIGAVLATTTHECTTIDLYFYGGPGLGSFTYSIDGGGAVAVNTASYAAGYHKVTVTGLSAATHTVTIIATASATYFGGLEYHSGKGVIVAKWARSSWGLRDTYGKGIQSDGAGTPTQTRAKQGYAMGSPNLVTLGWVRNDWMGQTTKAYSTTQYLADLEEIYGYVVAAGGCVLITGEPDDQFSAAHPSGGTITLDTYQLAAKEWAATKTHAAFMWIKDHWGTWAEGQALGLYRNAGDEIHPGAIGQGDVGRLLYQMLSGYHRYSG